MSLLVPQTYHVQGSRQGQPWPCRVTKSLALPGQGWVGLGENRDPRAKGQGWYWVIRGVILRCYCSRRISIAVFMDDDVLEWNLMFDDILYEKYLWLKWPECTNFCRTLHLDEGGVIYNEEKCCIVQHP